MHSAMIAWARRTGERDREIVGHDSCVGWSRCALQRLAQVRAEGEGGGVLTLTQNTAWIARGPRSTPLRCVARSCGTMIRTMRSVGSAATSAPYLRACLDAGQREGSWFQRQRRSGNASVSGDMVRGLRGLRGLQARRRRRTDRRSHRRRQRLAQRREQRLRGARRRTRAQWLRRFAPAQWHRAPLLLLSAVVRLVRFLWSDASGRKA